MDKSKKSNADKIREYAAANPKAKPAQIAKELGLRVAYVHQVQYNDRKAKAKAAVKMPKRGRPRKPVWTTADAFATVTAEEPKINFTIPTLSVDVVNNPPHYTVGGIETIDFIEAKKLPYNLGNVVKYVSRADHKGRRVEDLRKAQWYLNREIERVQRG
jgi:hypothetical protein